MSITYELILEAAERIKSRVHVTPVISNKFINNISGRNIYFKGEHLQKTGSFKARGALNAVMQLESMIKAVCCDSSGNHGQALAWAASQCKKSCHVAVPEGAPEVKVDAIKGYGGHIHFCPANDSGREAERNNLTRTYFAEMVHPSQDARVMAGQGTIGIEIFKQIPKLDVIVIPVGGGGLISGIATAIRHLNPLVKIIAAEPLSVDDCKQSFSAKKLIITSKQFTVCDGVRTNIGENSFRIIQHLVDDVITVPDNQVAQSWCHIMQRMKIVIEPTGALALAVALSDEFNEKFPKEKYPNVAVILCGGNLDLSIVSKMIQLASNKNE